MYPSNTNNTGCTPPYFLISQCLHNGNGQRNITLSIQILNAFILSVMQ